MPRAFGLIRVVIPGLIVLPAAASPPAPSALDLATARAVAYENAALRWTCDELVRRVRYRASGRRSESREVDYSLLLVPDPALRHAIASLAPADEPSHPLSRPPAALRRFPPVTSWLRLFHPVTHPWMLIRDDDAERADPTEHAFRFRGAAPIDAGDDLRAWEGTASVNAMTGDLLRIAAMPVAQAQRLAVLIDRRNRWSVPIDLFGLRFSIGPKAHGRRVEVTFGPHAGKFWLPSTARLEEFDAVSRHDERRLRATLVSIRRCREFETRSTTHRSSDR